MTTYAIVCFGLPVASTTDAFVVDLLNEVLGRNDSSLRRISLFENRSNADEMMASIILPASEAEKAVATRSVVFRGINVRFVPSKKMQESLGNAKSNNGMDNSSSSKQGEKNFNRYATNPAENGYTNLTIKSDLYTGNRSVQKTPQESPQKITTPLTNGHVEEVRAPSLRIKDSVMVTHVNDEDNSFYVVQMSQQETLVQLQQSVDEIAKDALQPSPLYEPEISSVVLAYSEPFQSWFRAYVMSKVSDGFKVYYPDFGNTEIVKASAMRPCSSTKPNLAEAVSLVLNSLPMAVNCSFAGKPVAIRNAIIKMKGLFKAESLNDYEWVVEGVYMSPSSGLHLLQMSIVGAPKLYTLPQEVMSTNDIVPINDPAALKRMEDALRPPPPSQPYVAKPNQTTAVVGETLEQRVSRLESKVNTLERELADVRRRLQ